MAVPDGAGDAGRKARVLLAAATLFAAVTLLRFGVGEDASDGASFLYLVPIALVATELGPVSGVAAACVAFGLFVAWTTVDELDVAAGGYATRGLVFPVIGAGIGWLAQRRAAEQARSANWFQMSNDMVAEASLDGHFTRLNGAWQSCLGWSGRELMSRPYIELVHPDDVAATLDAADRLAAEPSEITNFENRYRTRDGAWRWLLWSARADGDRIYAVAKDITERKRMETERERLLDRSEAIARTDSLTGLPNRRAWDEELRRELARSQRYGYPVAIALLDLDRFKDYNDAHGHPAGDELLRDAAVAWRTTLRVSDFIARVGGEEFGVLLPQCAPEPASQIVERVRAATPRGETCSAGIATWDGAESAESVIARADKALYHAKRDGRNRFEVAPRTVR